MRRLKILFFWLFYNKNNVSFKDMVYFLLKPKIRAIAQKHIRETVVNDEVEVTFSDGKKLFWPKTYPLGRLDQVISETFDEQDWHFYQKEHTTIADGELLLDIGTAEGLFPLVVIEKCSHIYMVEPTQTFCRSLEKTFSQHADKITIFNVAVGNEDGTVAFSEDSLDGTVVANAVEGSSEIPIRKIDSLISDDMKITYLKADIEGFEEEMLLGAEHTIKINKPKIAITTYHTQNDPNRIISIIKGFVPEYNCYVKGIYEKAPKPVMIHFWI